MSKSNLTRIKRELASQYVEKEYIKIRSDLDLLLKGQKINQKDIRLGFIGLAKQNSELIDLNKKVTQQLKTVVKEFNTLKKEREKKFALREARANRKRLSKSQLITPEIYLLLIQAAESPSYISVKLRIDFCLLAVTGVRINELLSLKVSQLQTLLKSGWIGIDRLKRGPANHKAFLRTFERLFRLLYSARKLVNIQTCPFWDHF